MLPYYSAGLIGIAVLLILNYKQIFIRPGKNNSTEPVKDSAKAYRRFLIAILIFYVSDVLWGIFDDLKTIPLLYADTVLFFGSMAAAVLLWSKYVTAYLDEKDMFGMLLSFTGYIFAASQAVILAVNFFVPILFWYDENGTYCAGQARDQMLFVQIAIFLLSSLFAMYVMQRSGKSKRNRYLAISLLGFSMSLFAAIQVFDPFLPLYSLGYMLGSCLLYVFVIQDEHEEYHRKLEEVLRREQRQYVELNSTKRLAYTDILTGAGNKLAYSEATNMIDKRIRNDGKADDFAIAVFDLNGLKAVNDTRGHDAGDRHILVGCQLICNYFNSSRVFRIGGDEFAVIIEGEDYSDRKSIAEDFDRLVEDNVRSGWVVISMGMSDYDPEEDDCCSQIFKRADAIMYKRKLELKKMGANVRG